jgi:hypothetical protein
MIPKKGALTATHLGGLLQKNFADVEMKEIILKRLGKRRDAEGIYY